MPTRRIRLCFVECAYPDPRELLHNFRACLHGGGGPQEGELTRLGGVTRLSLQSLILM